MQPKAEPVHRPEGLSQAQQVGREVGLQQVQEARGKRWEVEAPVLPLAPEQADTCQHSQQQQPEEQHGWRPCQAQPALIALGPTTHLAAGLLWGP